MGLGEEVSVKIGVGVFGTSVSASGIWVGLALVQPTDKMTKSKPIRPNGKCFMMILLAVQELCQASKNIYDKEFH